MNKLLEITSKISELLKKSSRVVIAIDGKCASGKSTLAQRLQIDYQAQVIHMDDYFLTPTQRTQARLNETGGNLDYERFYYEVILNLATHKNFSIKPFECKTDQFLESRKIINKGLIIIEGAYAMRKEFISDYDLKLFIDIDNHLQSARILMRNGKDMHQKFINEWIPKENKYIEEFRIKEKCDFILNQEDLFELSSK